jgi:hypothetical protein
MYNTKWWVVLGLDTNKNSYGNMITANATTGVTITPVVTNTWYVINRFYLDGFRSQITE